MAYQDILYGKTMAGVTIKTGEASVSLPPPIVPSQCLIIMVAK